MMRPLLPNLLNCPKQINNLSILFAFGFLFACEEQVEDSSQFNASGETLSVSVGVDEVLPGIECTLHSTTGLIEIGTASISPGGGPIGTEHEIQVEVFDDWENSVSSVMVKTESGSRGSLEYMLIPDSADPGLYMLTLESVGDIGEIREDVFTFNLWTGEAPVDSGLTE